MSDNIFDKAIISDEEWEKLKISRLSPRPNAKSSYGAANFNADRTKDLFDAQGNLLKEKHNIVVDYARKEEATRSKSESERKTAESKRIEAELSRVSAENERISAEHNRVSAENERISAELARKSAEEQRELTFIREQEQRNDLFENAETQRQSDYEAAEAERDRLFNIGEGLRFEAEGERSRAEENRVSAEEGRVKAEKLREETAAAREESFSYLAEPYKVPIRDEHGNIPIDDDESNIENRKAVAVSGLAVYLYVKGLFDALVNGAPGTMDTLKEIADLIGSGDDAATILGRIAKNAKSISDLAALIAEHEGEIAEAEADIVDLSAIVASIKKFCDDLIAHTPGDSKSKVMSQKATTDLLNIISEPVKETYSPSVPETVPYLGYIQISGVEKLNDAWVTTDYIVVNDFTTIKSKEGIYGNTATVPTATFYDADKNFISNILNDGTNGSYHTIDTTPPEGAKYVRLTFLKSFKSDWIQIEKLTAAFPKEYVVQTTGDSTEKVMSQKAVTDFVNGVATPMTNSRNLADIVFENANINVNTGKFAALTTGVRHAASPVYIPVIGGKSYTYSWELGNYEAYMYAIYYDESKVFISSKMAAESLHEATSDTLITPDNCAYVRLYALTPNNTSPWENAIPRRLQMELGETATPYVKPKTIDSEALDAYKIVTPFIRFNYANYGLPVLEFEGNTITMNKDNAVTLNYKYGDKESTCTLKWQGSSSLSYPKKNYTVKFDTAFEAKEGWGEQKKYCLKANYIDFSHSRNICSAKLWGGMVKSRTLTDENEELLEKLNALPNGGAIDGFPICVVINGEYKGIYTFNIPKDGWMFGMDKEAQTKKMAILCANGHDAASGSVALFRSYAECTDDLEIEYQSDAFTNEEIKKSVNDLIGACINSDGTDLDTTIAQYLDWESAIDYYIFYLIAQHLDGVAKNYLLVTYDGRKWFFSAYDLDSTFGLYVNGTKLMPNDGNGEGYGVCAVGKSSHRIFELIDKYKSAELKARYKNLVEGYNGDWGNPLSEDRVVDTFYNFAGSIPKALLDEEVKLWPTLPSTSVNNVSQIIDHYRRRRAFIDPQIEAL